MSLQHHEGFELTVDQASATRLYGTGNFTLGAGALYNQTPGRLQGAYFRGGSGLSTMALKTPLIAQDGTWVVGMGLRANTPTSALQLIRLLDSGTLQCRCQLAQVGADSYKIQVVNSLGSSVGESGELQPDVWYYVEFKTQIADVATWSLRVNEAVVASSTSDMKATANAFANEIEIRTQHVGGGGDKCDIDDLYFVNSLAGQRTDLLGDCVIEKLFPNADGATIAWTPNPGPTHFDAVDDSAPDDDTTYVTTNQNNAKELYQHSDLVFSASGTPILGIRRELMLRLLSAGSRNIRLVYRNAVGTENNSATLTYTDTGYATKQIINERNPITVADFSVTELNAAQFGMETIP